MQFAVALIAAMAALTSAAPTPAVRQFALKLSSESAKYDGKYISPLDSGLAAVSSTPVTRFSAVNNGKLSYHLKESNEFIDAGFPKITRMGQSFNEMVFQDDVTSATDLYIIAGQLIRRTLDEDGEGVDEVKWVGCDTRDTGDSKKNVAAKYPAVNWLMFDHSFDASADCQNITITLEYPHN